MAERGRKPGFRMSNSFYVYRIFDGPETVYVGKGSGRRIQNQIARFRLDGEIIEYCKSDDHAFAREVFWIKQLMPTQNKAAGGNGGRCMPKRKTRLTSDFAEIERLGSRRYVARILIRKLSERNCEAYGLSKVGLDRLREVANGPRC